MPNRSKPRRNSFDSDNSVATELVAHINTTGGLYPAKQRAIRDLLLVLYNESYTRGRGEAAFRSFVKLYGVPNYTREYGRETKSAFTSGVITAAASELTDDFESQIRSSVGMMR